VIRGHLAEMAVLPNPLKADLQRGFTVAQVAEKHGWTESGFSPFDAIHDGQNQIDRW
jgi:hypothetical protein